MKINIPELRSIALAGLVGGFAAWLIGCYTAQEWGKMWQLDLMAALVCGALAACVAVYLIANTNTQDVARCLAFAAVCGMCWKPVLNSAMQFVNTTVNQNSVSSASTELKQSIVNPPTNGTSAAILVSDATNLTAKIASLENNNPIRKEAITTAALAITTAGTTQSQTLDPKEIAELGVSAKTLQLPELKVATKEVLEKIAKESTNAEFRVSAERLSKEF